MNFYTSYKKIFDSIARVVEQKQKEAITDRETHSLIHCHSFDCFYLQVTS
jgi:hypothetical protein